MSGPALGFAGTGRHSARQESNLLVDAARRGDLAMTPPVNTTNPARTRAAASLDAQHHHIDAQFRALLRRLRQPSGTEGATS